MTESQFIRFRIGEEWFSNNRSLMTKMRCNRPYSVLNGRKSNKKIQHAKKYKFILHTGTF